MKPLIGIALVLGLAACGQVAVLKPQAGASLPPKPETARTVPTAEALMTPSDQARPRRTDELLQDSRQREPDRFDLPPPG